MILSYRYVPGLMINNSTETDNLYEAFKNPVFVVGSPRSGTTLLQNLLACHPRTCSAPETHFFIKITPCLLYERNLPPIWKTALPEGMCSEQIKQLFRAISASLELSDNLCLWFESLPDNQVISMKEISQRFFSDLVKSDCNIFIEKSPPHVYFIREIRSIFPDSKIINIVRDPRDIVPSINRMLEQMGKKPRSVYERTRIWNSSLDAAAASQLFTIRYEDLVADPQKTLSSVFCYLGLEYSEHYLDNHSQVSFDTVKGNEKWKENNFRRISSDRIGNFKKHLTADDIGLIEFLCHKHMETYNYKRTSAVFSSLRLGKESIQYYFRRTRFLMRRMLSNKSVSRSDNSVSND